MSTQPGMMRHEPSLFGALDIKWSWLLVLGIGLLILGSLAIIFPAATSVSIELILGILLVVAGVGRLVSMFRAKSWGDFFVKLLVAGIYLAAGVMLLAYPFGGTLTLTLLLAIFFVAQGLVNVVMSLMNRETHGWGWWLFNGIVSFALGALIWAELPSSAAWAIGLLVGVWLIFDGWALIMIALSLHGAEKEAKAF
ncbi:MAG: DUF308 domain-containing protein [Pseudomonadota bacterium]